MPTSSQTHGRISQELCGRLLPGEDQGSEVELLLTDVMRADDEGLVHGGFIFGAADYAAMLAINHPHVVLAGADVRFLKPARVGETLTFRARLESLEGKRQSVSVRGFASTGDLVFTGTFSCLTPPRHVLAN